MSFLNDAYKQARVWQAYAHLGSLDDAERYRAMHDLRACGEASLWCLRMAIRQTGQPRLQFAAAVVLHWLGNTQGMMTLTEALKWRLPADPSCAAPLESAFLTIGSPDSVTSLLTVWNMLPDWGDNKAVLASICRVWASLKNPAAIAPLIARATLIPDLFEKTIPAFGELAITPLRDMSRDTLPARRLLALRALRNIANARSFSALIPLLYDSEYSVRSEVPEALEATGGQAAAICEITKSVQQGFVTPKAVSYLLRAKPVNLGETFVASLECWQPDSLDHAASESLLLMLQILRNSQITADRLAPALCPLLEGKLEANAAAAVVQTLGIMGPTHSSYDDTIRAALWKQLASSSPQNREQAADALLRFGEPMARRILGFLDECAPNGSLLSKLHVILRGGPDAGQAASQAVQQVSQWFVRLSKDVPMKSPDIHAAGEAAAPISLHDPRLPEILNQMLTHALCDCKDALLFTDLEQSASFILTLLRAITRLGRPAVCSVWQAMLQALHFALNEQSALYAEQASLPETIRLAAVETWLEVYEGDCFPVFLEALYSPQQAIAHTAVLALGRQGDARAVPHLKRIAANEKHPLSTISQQAIALIQRTNPEMMTLLRGSYHSGSAPETLLRPASGNNPAQESDLLLRPTAQTSE